MLGLNHSGVALDAIAHIIQTALTPVFLLSGIATLLNVFSTRLARVADRVDKVSSELAGASAERARDLEKQLARLHRRSVALDIAVVLAAAGGASTCAAVLTLFIGSFGEATLASALVALFGLAVVCTLGAIVAYTVEMMLASITVRTEAAAGQRSAAKPDAIEAAEPDTHPDDVREDAPPAEST